MTALRVKDESERERETGESGGDESDRESETLLTPTYLKKKVFKALGGREGRRTPNWTGRTPLALLKFSVAVDMENV